MKTGVHEGWSYGDGGRLFAGTAEGGMGPRIREDNGGRISTRGQREGEGRFQEPVSKVSAPLSAVKRCDAKRNHAQ